MESEPVATDTQRLIGLLETALAALVQSQQLQAAVVAKLEALSAPAAPSWPAAPAAAPAQAPVAVPTAPAEVPASAPAAARTVSAWLDVHWDSVLRANYKPQTIKNRAALVAHIRRIWGPMAIAELRPHHISTGLQEFLPDRLHTACRVLGEFRIVMLNAVANDWAANNPAAAVKLPAPKIQRKRLTLDTWVAMWAHAQASRQQWVQCLLLLAVMTGQRRADLAKMRFDDIVTDEAGAQFLRVEQQKEAGKGYGARVEIPLALRLQALDLTVGQVIDLCRECGAPGPNLLRKSNGTGIELSSLSARFHETIVAVCGEDAYRPKEWPSLHEARSLSARLYDFEGHDVQTLLGHSAKEMTELYLNDRGLTAKEWKRVQLPAARATPEPA